MKKLLIPLALILLIPAYDALACSCVGLVSPCAAYQAADAVFVGVVKKTEPELPEDEMVYIEQTAIVEVEKGFKAAKAGDELVRKVSGEKTALRANKRNGGRLPS